MGKRRSGLQCSARKRGRGELLGPKLGQHPGHALLIDRVGVEVQVGVVDFVVIEVLKFWNHIDIANIFELAILYR